MAVFKLLFNFNATTGGNPQAGSVLDASGNLFALASNDGTAGPQVLELAWNGSAYAATPSLLATLPIGSSPTGLSVDAFGNLFGIALGGGTFSLGAVFEIPWGGSGYGAAVTLASFDTTTGEFPRGTLTIDRLGNLLGVTSGGGTNGAGTVFEIANGAGGYAGTPTVLGDLGGALGGSSNSGVIADAQGNLFGVTFVGASGPTLYEVPLSGSAYGAPVALASLDAATGLSVYGALAIDAQGDLFGVAAGGGTSNQGSIFELVKTGAGYAATPTLLYSFDATLGGFPTGQLLVDANGSLFGTASSSGPTGAGTVFELAHTGAGYAAAPTVLYSFDFTNGQSPNAGLTADASGDLFGTTVLGGGNGMGLAFEITGSDFAVGGLSIGGAVAAQHLLGGTATHPFATVTLSDANPGQTETVSITLGNPAAGALSDPNAAIDGFTQAGGVATLTGSAAQVTQALQGLVYTSVGLPANGTTVSTSFTIAAHDALGLTASDSGTTAIATQFQVISAPDGGLVNPTGALVRDASGNLLGAAPYTGPFNGGAVFEVPLSGGGYAPTPTVLAGLDPATASVAGNGVFLDSAGNLIGTSQYGDSGQNGAVYEVAATPTGYAASATVLFQFTAATGTRPVGPLISDGAGNLYGAAQGDGANGGGTVFELPRSGSGYAAPVALASFATPYADMSVPSGGLVMDADGNLFGATFYGGTIGLGTIFELPKTAGGYASTPVQLASLSPASGFATFGLTIDASGNLFGAGSAGGAGNNGTLFELPKTGGAYASAPTLLMNFGGASGQFPQGVPLLDAAGNLFGSADLFSGGNGTVYELDKSGAGYAASPIVLATFSFADGNLPSGGLIGDASGALFGGLQSGGPNFHGSIFQVLGSGFTVGALGITGTLAAQPFGAGSSRHPFSGVSITDANPGQTETVTITQAVPGAGTLSDPNAAADTGVVNGATFKVTGTAAQVTATLRGLLFTATSGDPTTGFNIAVQDTLGLTASDNTTSVQCFGAGTAIATPEGARAVETLRAGDMVLTASGEARAVRWLGVQTVAARFADPLKAWPVLVEAGALGAGLPLRNLVLSPGHALFVDGLLIQAGALAGCPGVRRVMPPAEIFSYFHVELDAHDLLLAEGAAAESYLPIADDLPFDNRRDRTWDAGAALPYPRVKAARQLPQRWRRAA